MHQHEPDGRKTGASPPGGTLRSFFSRIAEWAGVLVEFARLLAHRAGFRRSWQDGLGRAAAGCLRLAARAGALLGAGLAWLILTGLPWLACRAGRVLLLSGDGLLRVLGAAGRGLRGLGRALGRAGGRGAELAAGLCGRITFSPGRKVGDGASGDGPEGAAWPGSARTGAAGLALALARHPLFFGTVGVLAAAALACLAYLAVLAPWEPRPGEPTLAALANATPAGPSVRREVSPRPPAYEEFGGEELEERVKQADLVLLDLLKPLGPGRLSLSQVAVRRFRDRDYHFQALRLAVRNPASFLDGLREGLARHVQNASVRAKGRLSASILIDGQETHRLSLSPAPLPPGPRPAQVAAHPRMAIVIDDLGEDMALAQALAELPVPVAFSVWPDSSHAREAARLAREKGLDLLVHQPMEPRGYPKVNPGRNPLLTSMSRERIQSMVASSLDKVPGARGLNNHMGSRFTEDGTALRAVLEVLKARDMFFLDSMTTGRSAGKREAARLGVAFHGRDVFLDDVVRTDAAARQLVLAERLALTTGRAVVIGHPHPETLAALRAWVKTRDTRVAVVGVGSLPAE